MGKGNQVKMLQRPLGETWVCLRECKMVAMGAFGVTGIKEQGLDPNRCVPPDVALGRVPSLSQHGLSLSKGWMLLLTGTGSVKLRSWGALHEMTATVIYLKTLPGPGFGVSDAQDPADSLSSPVGVTLRRQCIRVPSRAEE